MNEAGDCDATMALVDRVAKSLRGKVSSGEDGTKALNVATVD